MKNWRVDNEVSHFRQGAMQLFAQIKADYEDDEQVDQLLLAEVVIDLDFIAESYAVAYKMAAADDLLAACKLFVALEDNDVHEFDTRWKQARQAMRAAIAKAEPNNAD